MLLSENDFVKDFEDGMTAKQLKFKYHLSNREYNELKKRNNLKRKNWTGGYNNRLGKSNLAPKNYNKSRTGFSITKSINGKNVYFCHTTSEEKAKQIVKKLRECNWDKLEVYRILYEVEKGINL